MTFKLSILTICGVLMGCSSNTLSDLASHQSSEPFDQEFSEEGFFYQESDNQGPSVVLGKSELPQQSQPTEPDHNAVQDLKIAAQPPALTSPVLGVPHPVIVARNDPSNFLTVMAQNGAVITVWALAQGNWLWIYPPKETTSFGNVRNWRLERFPGSEQFRFVNQQLNSCMQSYKNGVIHNRCDSNDLSQRFELLPTSSGAVYIKSVDQNRCFTYNTSSTTGYFTLTLEDCRTTNDPQSGTDQTWYLSPPLLQAHTEN